MQPWILWRLPGVDIEKPAESSRRHSADALLARRDTRTLAFGRRRICRSSCYRWVHLVAVARVHPVLLERRHVHAGPVVGDDDLVVIETTAKPEVDKDLGCAGVVGVLDELDDCEVRIRDQLTPKEPLQPGGRV